MKGLKKIVFMAAAICVCLAACQREEKHGLCRNAGSGGTVSDGSLADTGFGDIQCSYG